MVDDLRLQRLDEVLAELVDEAKQCFADDLLMVALFGSAAEERLRPSSDVNILFVLAQFDASKADNFRAALRTAHAAMRTQAMFLLRTELPAAAKLFAVKFNDIRSRHRVLYGNNLLSDLAIDDVELRRQLREVLLNLSIRLRERYLSISLREEQLISVITDATPPLRASALALLKLRGIEANGLAEALETVVADIGNPAFSEVVPKLSWARKQQSLPPGTAGPTLLVLEQLASYLREQLEQGLQP